MRDFLGFIALFAGVVVIAFIFWGMGVALWQSWKRRKR
jgi:hypothetical protein